VDIQKLEALKAIAVQLVLIRGEIEAFRIDEKNRGK
jgi:hypothetical protein